ncbi:hypothetical protein AS9A_1190 [Hoyosella subflava DQS3-9A1]|uniref:Uncharacterized protein n=1 Tax=Hoyosella subflava (strain DSM 45089 / JCM 17490 / NBRC 109087 / DQS3-9A1) TaxID=443218 RepID=F6ERR5_HOYSD|nr:hypothetical protein AS9A_1190 [Hoyosella subflava DQS3-9A1]
MPEGTLRCPALFLSIAPIARMKICDLIWPTAHPCRTVNGDAADAGVFLR